MTKRFYIASTGTDQGKTFVCAALCYQLTQQGKTVSALKPVISGFQDPAQSDSGHILLSLGQKIDDAHIQQISPWRFRTPVSPDLAASIEGQKLSLTEIADFCNQPTNADIQFIESAGGIMSPLTTEATNLDVAIQLNIPTILVSASYLGCISHILTAITVMKARNIPLQALVLTQPTADGLPHDTVLSSLHPHLPSELPLFTIPHCNAKKNAWQLCPDLTGMLAHEN